MQRVSALLPSWERPKSSSSAAKPTPPALDKVFGWANKMVVPARRLSSSAAPAPPKFGRETYWPTSLDKECEKAARILKSFCTDGYLSPDEPDSRPLSPTSLPPTSALITKKIPPRIIQNAAGLAIFSCMRSGLWMSGSGGSGILIARKADGTWSPPSGILLHTADLGFVFGVDIYDCVLVINNVAALEIFSRPRVVLGADVNLTMGPLVTTGKAEPDFRWHELDTMVLTYLKARGKHQAVDLDGSLVTERANENERFYSSNVGVLDILAGSVPKEVPESRPLFEVIKAAEGRTDFDSPLLEALSRQPAPGDAVIETPQESPIAPGPKSPFGIPDSEDPDPFGVIALEMAGLEIREAGTRLRPTSNQFEYNPSPSSPVFGRFNRQSVDTYLSRSNRGSYMSARTQTSAMTDAYTQTDLASTPETSHANSEDGRDNISERLPVVREPEEVDYTKIDTSVIEHLSRPEPNEVSKPVVATIPEEPTVMLSSHAQTDDTLQEPPVSLQDERDEDADDEDDDDDEDDGEEPVIYEVATAAQPTRTAIMSSQVTPVIQAKGALVTIPKRIPPPLPVRSPARTSRSSKSEYGDVSSLKSPLRNSMQSADLSLDAPESGKDEEPAQAVETAKYLDIDQANRGHHRGSSSVYSVTEFREPRWGSVGQAQAVLASRPLELASSADESDREPQTPRPEDDFTKGVAVNEKAAVPEIKEMNIESHHSSDSNVIPVA